MLYSLSMLVRKWGTFSVIQTFANYDALPDTMLDTENTKEHDNYFYLQRVPFMFISCLVDRDV